MVKVYTARNGARYIKLANGQCRFVSGASRTYLNKIRNMRGGHKGPCALSKKGRCAKSKVAGAGCEVSPKGRCKKVRAAAAGARRAAPTPAPAARRSVYERVEGLTNVQGHRVVQHFRDGNFGEDTQYLLEQILWDGYGEPDLDNHWTGGADEDRFGEMLAMNLGLDRPGSHMDAETVVIANEILTFLRA
jgi:hypothetical protein